MDLRVLVPALLACLGLAGCGGGGGGGGAGGSGQAALGTTIEFSGAGAGHMDLQLPVTGGNTYRIQVERVAGVSGVYVGLGVPTTPDAFFAGPIVLRSFGAGGADLYFTARDHQAHTLRIEGVPGSSLFTTRIRIDSVQASAAGLPAPAPVRFAHPATDGGKQQHAVSMGDRNCGGGFSLVRYPAVSDDALPEWLVEVDGQKGNGAGVGIINAEFQPVAGAITEEVVVGLRCRGDGIDVTQAVRVAAVRYVLDGDAVVEPGKSFDARLKTGLRGDVALLEGPSGLRVSAAGDIRWDSPRVPGGKGLAALVLDVQVGDTGPLSIRLPVTPAPGEGFLHAQSFDRGIDLETAALLADIDTDGTDELLYPTRGAIGIYPLDKVSTATLRTVPCLYRGSLVPRVAQAPDGTWQVYCVRGKDVRVYSAVDGRLVSRYTLESPGYPFPDFNHITTVGDLDRDGENDLVIDAIGFSTHAFRGGSGELLFSSDTFPSEAALADLGGAWGQRFVYANGTRDALTGTAFWEITPPGMLFADLWHFGAARTPVMALAKTSEVKLLDALTGAELQTWYPTGSPTGFDYRLRQSATGAHYFWSTGRDADQSTFGLWVRRKFVDPVTLDITDDPAFPRDLGVPGGIWRQYLHGGMQRLAGLSTSTQRVVYDLDGQPQATLTGDRLQDPYDGGALAVDDAGEVRVWLLFRQHQPHGGSQSPALVGYTSAGSMAKVFPFSSVGSAKVIHVRYDHDGDAIVDPVLHDGSRVMVISGATGALLYQSAMDSNLTIARSVHAFVRDGDLFVVPWVDGSTTTQVVFDIAGDRLLMLDLTQVGQTSGNGILPVDIVDVDGEPALEVSVDYPRSVEVYALDGGGDTILVSSRRVPATPLAAWTGTDGQRYYIADPSPPNEHVTTPVVLDMNGNNLCGRRHIDKGWRELDIAWNGGVVRLSGSPYKETSIVLGVEPCSGRVRWESALNGQVYGAGKAGLVLLDAGSADFKVLY